MNLYEHRSIHITCDGEHEYKPVPEYWGVNALFCVNCGAFISERAFLDESTTTEEAKSE